MADVNKPARVEVVNLFVLLGGNGMLKKSMMWVRASRDTVM